jgi:hypothetical protein
MTLILFLSFGFFGCETDTDNNLTPVAGDYEITGNLFQTLGDTEEIEVTAKAGRSTGNVTVYYRGIQGTVYNKSTVNPEIAGNFLVTFDVTAADGWNAAIDLVAGNLNISSGGSGATLFRIPITYVVNLLAEVGQADFLALMRLANPELVHVPDAMLIPQIPTVIFSQLTDMNSLVSIFFGGAPITYEMLSMDADVNFFQDSEGVLDFRGTDDIDNTTVFYSTVPFDLIVLQLVGAPRESFTIGNLLDEIGFNGTINYSLSLNDFLNAISPGTTFAMLNDQGLSFFSAETGGTMNGNSEITGADMTIWSNWPLEDVASMF